MKTYDVYGLGNALVDILVKISEEEILSLELEKATMRLVDPVEQQHLLHKLSGRNPHMASAGSVANSIYSLGQLGGNAAFSGSVGDDKYGLFYKSEFEGLKIGFPASPTVGATTGTCLVFITPDAERTMRTALAVSSDFGPDHVDEDIIRNSRWVFIEGYLLANPGKVEPWLTKTLNLCKKHQTKIAFTCSEGWVIQAFRDSVDTVLKAADLVFANESEAMALTGANDGLSAFAEMKKKYSNVAITLGEKGAALSIGGQEAISTAFPCAPVDLTGAGDAFAAGILYGINSGMDPQTTVRASCYLSSKVISHVGARYPGDLKSHWREIIEGM